MGTEAKKAFELALAKDSTSTEAQNGLQRVYQKSFEERNDPEKVRERVAKDPEVREIMSDPSMRLILEQMQQNPNALKDHLQNSEIDRRRHHQSRTEIERMINAALCSLSAFLLVVIILFVCFKINKIRDIITLHTYL